MLINEVESIVGLSKKSIRYYEENGLLKPKRKEENGYRIYDEEDIKKLKVIKFLRELGVPIKELQELEKGTLKLAECMEERIDKITKLEEDYESVKEMCLEIQKSKDTFQDIDMTHYFEKMNILNKKGFTMRDIQKDHSKKIQGAILSSAIFSFLFLFLMGLITYFQWIEEEKMPWFLYAFFLLVLGIPIIGIVYNLIERIREIKKGEEDEASKY